MCFLFLLLCPIFESWIIEINQLAEENVFDDWIDSNFSEICV